MPLETLLELTLLEGDTCSLHSRTVAAYIEKNSNRTFLYSDSIDIHIPCEVPKPHRFLYFPLHPQHDTDITSRLLLTILFKSKRPSLK